MRAGQSAKQLDDNYDKWKTYRELDVLHDRLNEIIVPETVENLGTDLEEAYVAGELDSEAKILVAVNATNARVNEIATALNAVLEKLRLET